MPAIRVRDEHLTVEVEKHIERRVARLHRAKQLSEATNGKRGSLLGKSG
jgi:hypothetical protein